MNTLIKHHFSDKGSVHSYIDVYEDIFQHKKNDNLNILEIGIALGGSLRLWHDYFVNAKFIVGIEPKDMTLPCLTDFENIYVIEGNGYTNESVNRIINVVNEKSNINSLVNDTPVFFDIIIDDGSHELHDMIRFLSLYLPLLNPNDGILVIEDLQDYNWGHVLMQAVQNIDPRGRKYKPCIVDLRFRKNWVDDILFIVFTKKIDTLM